MPEVVPNPDLDLPNAHTLSTLDDLPVVQLMCQNYFVPDPPEGNSGEVITEQAGYLSPEFLIEKMMESGEALNMVRTGMYDFDQDEEDPETGEPLPYRPLDFTQYEEWMQYYKDRISALGNGTPPPAPPAPPAPPDEGTNEAG